MSRRTWKRAETPTMKLRSVGITGVRGIEAGTYDLGDVTVISGPNGSGKTTILGSVIFALTGRFPGLPAMHQGGAALMARDGGGKPRFRVVLRATGVSGQEILLTRSWQDGKQVVTVRDGAAHTGKQAEAKIVSLFGDVAFAADALNPEGSVWGLSREKRKAWASALCRSAAGWTQERLIQEVGPATADWNPGAMEDAGASLDLNISRIQDAVRQAQAVARQAEGVAGAVSGDGLSVPSKEEVQKKQAAFEAVLAEVSGLSEQRRVLSQRRQEYERDAREREALAGEIARERAALNGDGHGHGPRPEDDVGRVQAERDDVEERVVQIEMELGEARADLSVAGKRSAVDSATVQGLAVAKDHARCPTCGMQGEFVEAYAQAMVASAASQARVAAATDRVDRLARQHGTLVQQLSRLDGKVVATRAALSAWDMRVESAKAARSQRVESLRKMELLAGRPAPAAPEDDAQIAVAIAGAQARLATARREMDAARSALALVREREAQEQTALAAREAAEKLKELLRVVVAARDRMLRESIEPLRAALKSMASTVSDGHWDAEIDGDALDIGLRRDGVLVPAETLSSGERYRLTAALLVARAKLRREPWVGIVFDGFEQVCPEESRVATLSALAAMVKAGDVDNAIFAAATEGRLSLNGATSIHLGK